MHIRDYNISQLYDKLQSEKQEKTYEKIIDVYRDKLTYLNITLCKECILPIKIEEGKEYYNSCQSI